MSEDSAYMLLVIYQALRLHEEMAFQALHASLALVKAVTESNPHLAASYHKHHDELVRKSLKKHSELLATLDGIMQRLKVASGELSTDA